MHCVWKILMSKWLWFITAAKLRKSIKKELPLPVIWHNILWLLLFLLRNSLNLFLLGTKWWLQCERRHLFLWSNVAVLQLQGSEGSLLALGSCQCGVGAPWQSCSDLSSPLCSAEALWASTPCSGVQRSVLKGSNMPFTLRAVNFFSILEV